MGLSTHHAALFGDGTLRPVAGSIISSSFGDGTLRPVAGSMAVMEAARKEVDKPKELTSTNHAHKRMQRFGWDCSRAEILKRDISPPLTHALIRLAPRSSGFAFHSANLHNT